MRIYTLEELRKAIRDLFREGTPALQRELFVAIHATRATLPAEDAVLAKKLLSYLAESPEQVFFGPHYGLDTDAPQIEVYLVAGDRQLDFLGGIDEERRAYLRADQRPDSMARLEAEHAYQRHIGSLLNPGVLVLS